MRPTPAVMGMKVRKTGMKRAITSALGPCLSMNCWARSAFSCLKKRELGRRKRALPTFARRRSRTRALAQDGGHRDGEHDQPQGLVEELVVGHEKTRCEQQRVAGQEEADDQAGFG
ncbi:hypothetical protein SHIRM173S_08067 [Streptomyces hirsutus]